VARVRVQVPVENPEDNHKHPANEHGSLAGSPEKTPSHHKSPSWLTTKRALVIVAVVVGLLFLTNLMKERNQLKEQVNNLSDSQVSDDAKKAAVLKELNKSVELPTNETPELRTIEDATKFTQQNPSLADIKNGDMLLLFQKSRKVVVYRPSTKKVVVVVTLSESVSDQSQQSPTTTKP